ncbi:MAG TPA: CBS domain-containing protein [Synergistaceae bacterium]|jgi:CBS domain-containing protein|nr:CBS domain-containing protein [Synergistaceae bacterium]
MTTVARDVMHRDLTAVMEDDLVHEAVRVLYNHNISGVPVLDGDWKLVGYLTESDILQSAVPTYLEVLAKSTFLEEDENGLLARFKSFGNRPVRDFMNDKPLSVEPDTSLMVISDLMIRKHVKRLPVVEDGRLVGIISREAFCEFLMRESGSRDEAGD